MNNIFKNNQSRFAALADSSISEYNETKNKKYYESTFKNNENQFNKHKKDNCQNINNEANLQKVKEHKITEKNNKINLSSENFPDLIIAKPVITQTLNSISFLDKIKTDVICVKTDNINIDLDYENLQPGCLLIKKDIKTGEIIKKRKVSLEKSQIYKSKTDQEIAMKVFNTLIELHEKRTNEYIDNWLYDEWEQMFRYPNYDYDYFEKLDELYEKEKEIEKEKENYNSEEDYYQEFISDDEIY